MLSGKRGVDDRLTGAPFALAKSIWNGTCKLQPKASLNPLMEIVNEDLELTNRIIIERMHSEVELIPTLAKHLIAAGGKRLRPVLTIGAAKLCGYEGERHRKLAACVEFIHTATLLHDDVVDESDMRRGNETANNLWGNQASVLVGDFLFSRSFQLMVEDGSLEVLSILSTASAVIAEGEVLQLMNVGDMAITEETYMEVIRSKTAALFAAACRVGAVVADRPTNEADALENYGRDLGVAFQLIDDVLDYSAAQADLGKNIGDDFREAKVTLPLLISFGISNTEEQAFWQRTIGDHDQRDGDLETALEILARHGAIEATIERAREYGTEAKAALDMFEDSPAKAALKTAVDFAIERAY